MNINSMRCSMTREEQKTQRRQLIITKSLELFVKKGYSETKISDINPSLLFSGTINACVEKMTDAIEIIQSFCLAGVNITMNKYNKR